MFPPAAEQARRVPHRGRSDEALDSRRGDSAAQQGGGMASLTERMVGAMQADVRTFEEIEKDPTAVSQAIIVILIAGFAALVGNIFRTGVAAGVSGMIVTLAGYALWTLIVVVV